MFGATMGRLQLEYLGLDAGHVCLVVLDETQSVLLLAWTLLKLTLEGCDLRLRLRSVTEAESTLRRLTLRGLLASVDAEPVDDLGARIVGADCGGGFVGDGVGFSNLSVVWSEPPLGRASLSRSGRGDGADAGLGTLGSLGVGVWAMLAGLDGSQSLRLDKELLRLRWRWRWRSLAALRAASLAAASRAVASRCALENRRSLMTGLGWEDGGGDELAGLAANPFAFSFSFSFSFCPSFGSSSS